MYMRIPAPSSVGPGIPAEIERSSSCNPRIGLRYRFGP
jgi:hypothetical protein